MRDEIESAALERHRAWRQRMSDKQRERERERRRQRYADGERTDPAKKKAHEMVARAVRQGRVTRLPCEVCGFESSQAHHEDYTKPLEVVWLCPTHHAERHPRERVPSLPCVVCGKKTTSYTRRRDRCRACYVYLLTFNVDRSERLIALAFAREFGVCPDCGGRYEKRGKRWSCRHCRAAAEKDRRERVRLG
jgi:hypothetical protein